MFLIDIITQLQEPNIKLEKQLNLLEEAKTKLTGFAKEKLQTSLSKNPDLVNFTENRDFTQRVNHIYAPLVSVDVERSFSQYKLILNDRRKSLSTENLIMINCIQYNSFLNSE